MTDLDLNQRRRILGKVSHLVETKHFNPALRRANWPALVAERFDRILTASGPETFEKEIQALVSQLRTSHTGFFHKSGRTVPARHAINATFKACPIDGAEHGFFRTSMRGAPRACWGFNQVTCCSRSTARRYAHQCSPYFGWRARQNLQSEKGMAKFYLPQRQHLSQFPASVQFPSRGPCQCRNSILGPATSKSGFSLARSESIWQPILIRRSLRSTIATD